MMLDRENTLCLLRKTLNLETLKCSMSILSKPLIVGRTEFIRFTRFIHIFVQTIEHTPLYFIF